MKWILILAVLLSMHSKAQKQSLCYEISNEELGIERSYILGTTAATALQGHARTRIIHSLLSARALQCYLLKTFL